MQRFLCHQTVSLNPLMKCVLIYMQLFRYAVNSNYVLRFLFSIGEKYDREALCFQQYCKSCYLFAAYSEETAFM